MIQTHQSISILQSGAGKDIEKLKSSGRKEGKSGRFQDLQYLCNSEIITKNIKRNKDQRKSEDDFSSHSQYGKYYLNPIRWNDDFKAKSKIPRHLEKKHTNTKIGFILFPTD